MKIFKPFIFFGWRMKNFETQHGPKKNHNKTNKQTNPNFDYQRRA